MAVFKCKMCGGSLETAGDINICRCDYCGTEQTLPKAKDDISANLFNRANNLRTVCEFDKALEVYETIIQTSPEDPEAYWGMVLCKYGIEYVDDALTKRKIPTCHRTLYESVFADVDYKSAMQYADEQRKSIYKREAGEIDSIQKNILEIVRSEKPFDVFICYKETDENGTRTKDSAIANDIYYQLKQEGFKVFYSAITLEDKLGKEYEPYIFAALQSAMVMLVIGTKPEYFSAPWVKNEWSRYLKFIKNDRGKLLIPCYKDMDAYDLPEEFARLQSQDMSRIGFINDIIRGIKKILADKGDIHEKTDIPSVHGETYDASIDKRLQRVMIFLKDADYTNAVEFCERILNADPECAKAYYLKFLAEHGCRDSGDVYSQTRIDYLADYYIKGYGYDVYDSHIFSSRVQYVLGNSIKNAVSFSRGAEHDEYVHIYDGMSSLIRSAVTRKEEEKLAEEKRRMRESFIQKEKEENERKREKNRKKRRSLFQTLSVLCFVISFFSFIIAGSNGSGNASWLIFGVLFIGFLIASTKV